MYIKCISNVKYPLGNKLSSIHKYTLYIKLLDQKYGYIDTHKLYSFTANTKLLDPKYGVKNKVSP